MIVESIHWLGHGSFLIDGPPFIYIDPWRVTSKAFHPDAILISHDHYDHCSTADVEKLRGPETIVIGNERVANQINEVTILRPWQSLTLDHISIKAIPAYSPSGTNHPQQHGGLGYLLSVRFYDIYFAGDTKIIPEMALIKPDVAILPIDDNDTLSISEAVEVVRLLKPRWVIPCNWSESGDGATLVEAQSFKRQVGELATVIIPDLKQRKLSDST